MKLTRKNISDFIIIIIIFALTGLTTVFASDFIINSFGVKKWSAAYILGFVFVIFPLYHVLLLAYAFIFGKFDYFKEKLKVLLKKIVSLFS
jgi:hypothetical protein